MLFTVTNCAFSALKINSFTTRVQDKEQKCVKTHQVTSYMRYSENIQIQTKQTNTNRPPMYSSKLDQFVVADQKATIITHREPGTLHISLQIVHPMQPESSHERRWY